MPYDQQDRKKRQIEIGKISEEVLRTWRMWELPVDPFEIANKEDIELQQGVYGEGFDARIEYYPTDRFFCIFYKAADRTPGRIRFSVGHELGHYYIPEHSKLLVSGYRHNSDSNYHSHDEREQEADDFSASLLMPFELFRKEVKRFSTSVCNLKDLCDLAKKLGTSVASTAVRYCEANIEPVLGVFSEDGIVKWTCCSEEMKYTGCWFVKWGSHIPEDTQTAKLIESGEKGPIGHRIDPHRWFDLPRVSWLYEETMRLGSRTLTWFTIDT